MWGRTNVANARIVRLNAELHPVTEYEREQYARFNLAPIEIEAHTPEEIVPHVAQAAAVFAVSVSLPAAVIDAMQCCLVISRMGTGVDKIDVEAATRNGIVVTNVPFFCVEEQADHAMALLLALARKLPQMSQAMHEGAWSRARALMRTNQRIPGQVLGLVGFGNSAKAHGQARQGVRYAGDCHAPQSQTPPAPTRQHSVSSLRTWIPSSPNPTTSLCTCR